MVGIPLRFPPRIVSKFIGWGKGRGVNYDKVGAGLIPSRGWLVLHCPP